MTYVVEMKNAMAAPLLVVRRRARPAELSRVVPDGCGAVWNFIRASGVKAPGRNVAIYRHGESGLLDVEVGVEVGSDAKGGGEVVVSATPAGPVATVAHIGPYSRLAAANRAIAEWCRANHHEFAGPSWEVYGHWTDDETKLRTDVFYLLKSGR